MTLDLKPGDPWPFQSSRGLTGRPLFEPVWYGLITPPQREAKAAHILDRAGATVEYPVDDRVRHQNGKKYEYTVPMISGIIYAQFEFAPNWDVMKERRIISGVFSRGETPVVISDAVVRAIMGLPLEEDRMEQARIAAMTPAVGETVKLAHGPFSGFYADVERTHAGRVWYEAITRIGRIKGEASVEDIIRAAE